MTDTLLRSLRDRMLDESEPLAGLLRKCLLLGAETGSDSLREWARKELNGYGDNDDVPDYRQVQGVPISMDSISGNTWTTGQIIDRHQLPQKAWAYVPEAFPFKQPVEELEKLAGQKALSFTSPGLAYAQTIWNGELGPWQNIVGLSYVMVGSAVAGIIGQVRTNLVDLIADLTTDTPLSELPGKEQVDAALTQHVGQTRDIYNTTVHEPAGPTAIGSHAKATTEGLRVEDALRLLGEVQSAAAEIEEDQRAELERAVASLRAAIEEENPDTGEVVKKAGKLRVAAEKLGVVAVSAATSSATQVVTELAVSGAFG